jgi:hypothetical protein
LLAAAVLVGGLCLAPPLAAAPPSPQPSANQQIADAIAEQIRQSGQLRQYTIDIEFTDGTAELTGQVADQMQREEVLRLVQGVPGVDRVRDRLVLANSAPITRVQNPLPPTEPGPLPRPVPGNGPPPEPMPIFQAPPGTAGPPDANPPRMPPFAWPSYSPYPNFSRVAYPLNYPAQAWPFIGPQYPFPKVPLGWRSVKLEWQDGHWWYGPKSTKYNFWKLKYW